MGQTIHTQGRWKYFKVRGGAEICVTIPTSGGLGPPDPLLVIVTYVMRTMHLPSVKVTRRQLDELELSSS